MPKQEPRPESEERLREALEALPGVHRAVVEGAPDAVFVITTATGAHPPVEAAVQALLAREGYEPGAVAVHISYLAVPQQQRRARFVEIDLQRPRVGSTVAKVVLEWAGERFVGKSEGQGSEAAELRACAIATTEALEAVLKPNEVRFSVVGIKAIRIFDTDLVSVLLHSEAAPGRQLIGVSLVTESVHRSAVLAVLNATNRLLGNYMATPD